MANKHILHINDVWVNVRDQLATTQLALLTDSDNQIVHRLGSVYYISQVQQDWNGAAFTYHDFFCNDLTAFQDVIAARYVSHYGDSDTRIAFTTDQVNVTAGGVNFVDFVEGGADLVRFNTGQVDIDFIIHTTTANTFFVDGANAQIGILTTTVNEALNINGNVQFTQGANRVIDVQARSGSGVGYNLTVQAGDANTTGAGGFLYLVSGDEAGAEGDGEIHIDANPTGTPAQSGDIYITCLDLYLSVYGGDVQFVKGYDIKIHVEDQAGDNDGDSITIEAGDSGAGAPPSGGGSVTIRAGDDTSGGAGGGSVVLQAGTGASNGYIQAGIGGDVNIEIDDNGITTINREESSNNEHIVAEFWADQDQANSGVMYVEVAYHNATAASRYVNIQAKDGGDTARYLNLNPNGGNVGIGTLAPDGTLHVHTATAGAVSAHADADNLVVENSGNVGLQFLCPNGDVASIYFGDLADNDVGQITYNHTTNLLAFITNATTVHTMGTDGLKSLNNATIHCIAQDAAPTTTTNGALWLDTNASANGSLYCYGNGAWRKVIDLP